MSQVVFHKFSTAANSGYDNDFSFLHARRLDFQIRITLWIGRTNLSLEVFHAAYFDSVCYCSQYAPKFKALGMVGRDDTDLLISWMNCKHNTWKSEIALITHRHGIFDQLG